MRVVRLALADLWFEKVHLICAIAMIAGVVVPLAILLGVKTGVYTALVDDLRADREILRVSVPGDYGFTLGDAAEVRGWEETAFVAPSTRAITRRINVKRPDGDRIRRVALVPGGPGDPVHPPGIAGWEVALSAGAAARLGAGPGDALTAVAQRGEPPTDTLTLDLRVAAVLPPAALDGETALMDPATMDLIEAFYDGYAVPDHGVTTGPPRDGRSVVYESLRLYARDLATVAALERRLEARFDIDARSQAGAVESTLRLGANLSLALGLVAVAALGGLFAALLSTFWAAVARKRQTLAMLALLGLSPGERALYPVVQAAATALAGALVSLILLAGAAAVAGALFADQMPPGAAVIALSPVTLILIVAGVVALGALAALLAARAAARLDPALVLREG